ncbi:MAG TPA: exodeoxyribonuclease VII large subunit [Candidatus Sulfotelmatobacter sp.]|nr:exodeoxyribonuclease VII large subunit [Candidatus Sulfotelmatobacter sp.]
MEDIELSVSEFIGLVNQTLEYAYPIVNITGELANFRVSKNRWVYFDLKDEYSSLRFFASVFSLKTPLEDGMLVSVKGRPSLHNLYGFSVNVMSVTPSGEGSIKKAAELLKLKLTKEGLFDQSRKRLLPYPPQRIGLITSKQSAAFGDFKKIINSRWQGLSIDLIDVQVQGEPSEGQIIGAINLFNSMSDPVDVLVIIRGGGSPEDLAAFSGEALTRVVAASRIPTLVGVGHETDISLAELAADQRASTPSNAAELLVPDKKSLKFEIISKREAIREAAISSINRASKLSQESTKELEALIDETITNVSRTLKRNEDIIDAYNPRIILNRGYAIVRDSRGSIVKNAKSLDLGEEIVTGFAKGQALSRVLKVDS